MVDLDKSVLKRNDLRCLGVGSASILLRAEGKRLC